MTAIRKEGCILNELCGFNKLKHNNLTYWGLIIELQPTY